MWVCTRSSTRPRGEVGEGAGRPTPAPQDAARGAGDLDRGRRSGMEVLVAAEVGADAVGVGETEHLGDGVGVHKVVGVHLGGHAGSLKVFDIGGSSNRL